MTVHNTKTGHVEFISEWGHGKGRQINPKRPATIITDDGDGHYQAWGYTGDQLDALKTLAGLERRLTSGDGYVLESAPEDFWIENGDGDFKPNTNMYPRIIAW